MPADRTEAAYALEQDEIITAIQGIEDRIAAFAADQELQLEELRQTVDQLQLEQRQAEAEIALYGEQATSCANQALARADESVQRLATLAAASQVREIVGDAELPDSLPAGPDALAGPLQAIEERLALFFGQHETRLEELRHRVEESAREAASTELLSRLSAGWDTLTSAVRDVEQRLAVRQESGLEELRQLVDQTQREQRQVAGEAALRGEQATMRANEAVARADETLRRLEAVATASQAHQASITELLDRLSSRWDGVTHSVRAVEQRVAAVAAEVVSSRGLLQQRVQERPRVEREALTDLPVPARRWAGLGVAAEPLRALSSWLALTAPGVLLALALLTLMLIAAPWLSSVVQVAPSVRATAAFLLLAHAVTAVLVLTRGRQWFATAAVLALLGGDALGAGLLFGADVQATSPAISLCLAVLLMSSLAGGWLAGLVSTLAAAVGVAVATYGGFAPLLFSAAIWFPTTLSVETSFANVPALAVVARSVPTMLSIETFYRGSPIFFVGSSAPLFIPVLAMTLVAICIGAGANLLWARKARGAVAAEVDAAHRSMVRV